MPRIKDIVDEALEIVFDKLKLEPLVREGLMNAVQKKSKNKEYYKRRINMLDPEEVARKKRLAMEKSLQVRVNLAKFTEFELEVMRITCEINKVNIGDFVLYSRKRELVETRFQFAAVLLIQFHYTYMKVGRLLGKDHSTIVHAIRQHCDFYDTITSYKTKYNQILNKIEEKYPESMTTKVNPNIVIQTLDNRQRRMIRRHGKNNKCT
jgi:chromosomal replication initiation ATPase DnaA